MPAGVYVCFFLCVCGLCVEWTTHCRRLLCALLCLRCGVFIHSAVRLHIYQEPELLISSLPPHHTHSTRRKPGVPPTSLNPPKKHNTTPHNTTLHSTTIPYTNISIHARTAVMPCLSLMVTLPIVHHRRYEPAAILNACGSQWGQAVNYRLHDGTPVINSVCIGPSNNDTSNGHYLYAVC